MKAHVESHGHPDSDGTSGWREPAVASALCLAFLLAALATSAAWPIVSAALFAAAFIAGMRYPLPEMAQSLAHGQVDVDLLMVVVALGAWFLGHPGEGASLLALFGASRAMEAYARGRTRASVKDLVAELPSRAMRVEGGQFKDVAVLDLVPGDTILVRAGERVAVDCEIVEGETTLDLSAITGESAPSEAKVGTDIPSGAVNGGGVVRASVTRLAAESSFQKIIHLIENAPMRRSPAQELSDKAGRIFTVTILSVSAVAFLAWWLGMGLTAADATYRAMALLVAGSPCAIVLSVPSAILAAIASGARRGILFNGGRGLAALAGARMAAFDKTGTLSVGIPGVVKVTGPGAEDPEMLGVAWDLARSSTHPASLAIARNFREEFERGAHPTMKEVHERAGRGMTGEWHGRKFELGRARGCDALDGEDREYSRVVLYADGKPSIHFYLAETPREDAAQAVAALRARGLTPLIISGDTQAAVDRLAKQVGIADARGELRPEGKVEAIRALALKGGVMMVGDGVNDAPALVEADVAVAMGVRGSAATLAQADMILAKDRLIALPMAVDLARRTRRVVAQNLTIAIGAAAVLMAFALLGHLPLLAGVFGHEGGTVLVVLNSLRLLSIPEAPPAPPTATVRATPGEAAAAAA